MIRVLQTGKQYTEMSRFKLHDLESLTGIKSDTIRMWERRYNILSPNRTPTNRRWYDDDDLRKLINISVIYHNGIKISKIAAMEDNEIMETSSLLSEGSKTQEDIISSLVLAMNSFDENAVNETIMRCVINTGFEKTFTEVLFPFLQKVGVMWHTGAIDITTEHFITSLFRQRLISAADSLPSTTSIHGKRVLMFLPEGEFHELALLFYFYVIRKRGHRVLYLGQATPFDSMISACAKWSPDIVITGLRTELNISDPEEYLKMLSAVLGRQKIYAGGVLANYADKLNRHNVMALRSETDLDFLT